MMAESVFLRRPERKETDLWHKVGHNWSNLAAAAAAAKYRPKHKHVRLPVVSVMKLKAAHTASASIFSLLIAFGKKIKDAT